jgi:hypothetical protein
MLLAAASAGGSVMLPANRPANSTKFIASFVQAKMPIASNGAIGTMAPAITASKPDVRAFSQFQRSVPVFCPAAAGRK